MQQRRFAGARRRHQGHRLTGPERKLGAVEDGQRHFTLHVLALDLVKINDRYVFPLRHRGHSLVPQRFDGIEPRGAPGRIKRGEEGQRQRHNYHGGGLADIDFSRQPGEEIQFRRKQFGAGQPRQELPDRFDVQADHEPDTQSDQGADTPIAAPVIRNTRMIEPCEAPMVRRIAMSLPLSFTSMIRPEMMFSAATSTIRVRIMNITLRSTCSALKKVELRCRQSTRNTGRPAASVTALRNASMRSGLVVNTSIELTSPLRLK